MVFNGMRLSHVGSEWAIIDFVYPLTISENQRQYQVS